MFLEAVRAVHHELAGGEAGRLGEGQSRLRAIAHLSCCGCGAVWLSLREFRMARSCLMGSGSVMLDSGGFVWNLPV
jgi:hypothetical protein